MRTRLTNEQLKQEILESHERSKRYGICQEERSIYQKRLTPVELEARRKMSQDLIDVASDYIDQFYELLSPDQFMIAVADNEGYILTLAGSDDVKAVFADRNCAPGYRWTEKDVGTAAISICLKKQIPVQLNDKDHFCRRAHGFTSSAAPIFGPEDVLQGVLVVSGKNRSVHPHTLIMVTSAASSLEKQIRLIRQNREMSTYTGFMNNVIESAETGLLTMDKDLRIWKTNRKAKQILKQKNLDGKPISILSGLNLDLQSIHKNPNDWKNKECHIRHDNKTSHLVYSAQPVMSDENKLLGAVLVFEEFKNLQKLADKISGTKAYFTFNHLIGNSPEFLKAVELAKRASESNSTVLLAGETGTGKELFAQAIHNGENHEDRTFIPINCGAIPGELIESELFGYVDGAFTGALKGGKAGKFELADSGTILLDEIGDMPLNMQVKLLRTLQTGEVQRIGADQLIKVNTRIIASTNVDLLEAVAKNRFRKDLYYRLNIIQITLPPLRKRGAQDIEALADYFVKKNNPHCSLTREALAALISYDWPGNARELENTIQRALHICDGIHIKPEHLGLPETIGRASAPIPGTLREMEEQTIAATLSLTNFNMAQTAKKLGISRATLYRKTKQYNL